MINNLISEFLKILRTPLSLEIITLLKESDKTQKEISKKLNLSQSYVSQMLKRLEKAYITQSYIENKKKKFKIKDTDLLDIIDNIKNYILKNEKKRYNDLLSGTDIFEN